MSDVVESNQGQRGSRELDSLRSDLLRYRRMQRVTQSQLAPMLGITQAALSAFETHKNVRMRPESMDKLERIIREWRNESNIVSIGYTEDSEHPDLSKLQSDSRLLESLRRYIVEQLGGGDKISHLVHKMSPLKVLKTYLLADDEKSE